jgi:hypothetical protein
MKQSIVAIVNDQIQFWKREFNATIIIKDDKFYRNLEKIVKTGIVPVVQIENNPSELEFFRTFPNKSIVAWCASDELQDFQFAKTVSSIKSFALILRPYHLNEIKLKNIFYSTKYLFYSTLYVKSQKEFLSLLKWFITGLNMGLRQEKIIRLFEKRGTKFVNFPLGYTDVFCKSYMKLIGCKPSDVSKSLLDKKMHTSIKPTLKFIFIGQSGQILRRVAIRALEKEPEAMIINRTKYGAGNYRSKETMKKGIEYVRLSLTAKFVLCPPGNISGNTFRIHESIVMRRIPLVIFHVTSDPNFKIDIENVLGRNDIQNWKKLFEIANMLSEKQYNQLINSNIKKLNYEISTAKQLILICVKDLQRTSRSKDLLNDV